MSVYAKFVEHEHAYDGMSISSEYSIIEKPVNPSTGIITPYIICGFVACVGVVGTIPYRKKKFM